MKLPRTRESRTAVDRTTALATVDETRFMSVSHYQSVMGHRETTRTPSVTQLCAGTQYIQVTFQYTLTMPSLAISPLADNDFRKRFKI
jgi:hypothetical protein